MSIFITDGDIKQIIDDAKLKAIIRNDKECTYHDIIMATLEKFWKINLVLENRKLKTELYFLKTDLILLKNLIKKIQNIKQNSGLTEYELEDLEYLMKEENEE